MMYKPENVKLVITHDGVEQEVQGIVDYPINFDESTCIEILPPKKNVKSSKPSRCKDNMDWVEEEYGDAYEKPKKGSQSGKQSIPSTIVKQLTKSEIESLRQNKRDAYALMMKMN